MLISSNIINNLPGFCFWKDTDLVFQEANIQLAEAAGFRSPEQIQGVIDDNLPWAEYMHIYNADDREAIEGGVVTRLEPLSLADGNTIWTRVIKQPHLDVDGNIIGVFGFSVPVLDEEILSQSHLLDRFDYFFRGESLSTGYRIVEKFPFFNLSVRESECLFYLMRGKTAKEIGVKLSLSPRTVEAYIENIKMKMGCMLKGDLIERAVNMGLVAYLPNSLVEHIDI